MGCSGSRLGHGHAGMVLPPRLRPLFLLRLEEFRMRHRRHIRPIKDSSSTTSKIILLQDQRDEDENSMDSVGRKLCEGGEGHGKPKLEAVCEKINVKDVKAKEESEFEDALTDAYNSNNDDDDDDEDDGRMIGRGDCEAFPASPSFRVYFKDVVAEKGEVKNTNAFKSAISGDDDVDDNEIISYKESCDEKKKVKKGRRRKSFNKVLPKGGQTAVKNLFTISLCYTTPPSSPSSSPHHHHRRRRHNRKDMNALIQG